MNRTSFRAKTVQRFMSESEYRDFVKKYEDNRGNAGAGPRPVNEKDFAVLSSYKKGNSSIKHLSKEFGITESAVRTSLLKASLAQI